MSNAGFWEQYPQLSRVNSPDDVKAMSAKELDALAEEMTGSMSPAFPRAMAIRVLSSVTAHTALT